MTAAKQAQPEKTDNGADNDIQPMITEEELLKLLPFSRSTLHRLQKDKKFPKGKYVSANRKLYVRADVARWQRAVDEFNPNRGRGKGRRRRVSPSAS